ncbi:MAG: tetratricopeptide repeat protein [Planctomycetes bacterium]|nr:tetratricopeptide repeat protein [Planctomycetota bacterium]
MQSRRLILPLFVTTLVCLTCWVAGAAEPDPGENSPRGADARSLAAANGFLNRGHFDLAIQEYRRYLSANPNSNSSDTARYGLAVALFRTEKKAEAVEPLVALDARDDFQFAAEVDMMLGQCRMGAGDLEKAAQSFRNLLDAHANHALADDAAAQLVEVLFRMNNDVDAAGLCSTFFSKWGKSPQADRAAYFGGLAELRLKHADKAANRFKWILEKHKDSAFAAHAQLLFARSLQESDPDGASAAYKIILSQSKSPYRDDAALGLAGLYRMKGDYEAAAKLLEPLVDTNKNSPFLISARLQLAHVEFGRGNFQAALRLFQKLASDSTNDAEHAGYWAAKCHLRLNQPADAARLLDSVVKSAGENPQLPEMLFDLAVARHRDGQAQSAVHALKELVDRFENHSLVPSAWHLLAVIAHESGEYAESLKWTTRFLSQHGEHELTRQVLLLAGENEYLLAHYGKSERLFRSFLEKNLNEPGSSTAQYRLGMALYHQEKYDEAHAILSQLEAGDTKAFGSIFLALGDMAFRKQEWTAARDYLTRHLQTKSADAADEALLKCGLCAARLEKHGEAVELFDRLLADFPESAQAMQARFERGQSLMVQSLFEKAAADFDAVLKIDEASRFAPAARRHLAAIAMQNRDFASAAKQYESLSSESQRGDNGEILYQQAIAQLASKDEAGARKTLRKLLRRFKDSPRANLAKARLAILEASDGKCKEFMEMQGDIDVDSLDPAIQRSLAYEKAWCLKSLVKPDDAMKSYRSLLEQSADDAVAAHSLVEISEMEMDAGRFEAALENLSAFEKLESVGSLELPVSLREQALYRHAVALFNLKQFGQSARYFDRFCKAFETSDMLVSAGYFQGESHYQSGEYSAAASCFDRVIAGKSSPAERETSLLRAGDCRAKLQEWAKSEAAFEGFLDQFSSSEQWYQAQFGLGWARENQGRHGDAVKCYRKVVERHSGPTAARAQFQIGQCLFAQNKLEDAVAELLKVDILYAYPEWSAAALYEAGRCFEQMNKMAEAGRQFKTVAEKYKSTKWAELARTRLEAIASIDAPGRGT